MKEELITKELLNLEVQMKIMLERVQELLLLMDVPEPNPKKRQNLKQARVAQIDNYRSTRRLKRK